MGKPCFKCGAENLSWKKIEEKWVGFAPDGSPHSCVSKKKGVSSAPPAQPPQASAPKATANLIGLQKAIEDLTKEMQECRKLIVAMRSVVPEEKPVEFQEDLFDNYGSGRGE